MQRCIAFAFLALVLGCGDEGAKVVPAQPVQGDAFEDESYEEGYEEDGDPTLVAENEGAEPSTPCAVSFTKDVMPKLSASCGSAACHMETTEPFVDDAAPQITFEGLRDFGFDDESWIDPHPSESGLAEPGLKAAIDGWRACGAPFE